jgi:Nucleotidyltransferase domain
MSKMTREIVRELIEKHDATAIILYGSHAAGAGTETSDWDVLALSKRMAPGVSKHDARPFQGTYLDAFIESEALADGIREEHLRLLGGQILHDTNELALRVMALVEALHAKGPKLLTAEARQGQIDWLWRTFERAQGGTMASDLRRVQLLGELLPTYFTLRGTWFLGVRTSLAVLEKKDPHAFALFQRALLPDANLDDIRALVALVTMQPQKQVVRPLS